MTSNNTSIDLALRSSYQLFAIFFSFNRLLLQKEELEQKHLHLLQIVESEKTAKWQYSQQCDELTTEIKKLRNEVSHCGICLQSSTRTLSCFVRCSNQLRLHFSLLAVIKDQRFADYEPRPAKENE